MAKGDTKTNQYLDIAANGTRADLPTDTCCETRTQTLIRGVAERIMDVEDEVEEIKNNPDVVDIVPTYAALQNYDTSSLTDKDIIRVLQDETHDGDSTYYRYNKQSNTWTYVGESKQYTDFVGTDGTTAGTAGLVPAPATTDAGKYLGASGLWETIQAGGGITELTSADYNWPTSNPDGVAIWKLNTGIYTHAGGVKVYYTSSVDYSQSCLFALHNNGYQTSCLRIRGAEANMKYFDVQNSNGSVLEHFYISRPVNSLTSTNEYAPLSANQGKVLKDLIDSIAIRGTGAPTTSTVGQVGTLYEDTTNGDLYICTDATNPYVWEEVGSGGGGGPTVVQTTGTSTTDVMSQNAVTSMVFADPGTNSKIRIGNGGASFGSESIIIGDLNSSSEIGSESVVIGHGASSYYGNNVALGHDSGTGNNSHCVAIGHGALCTGLTKDGAIALGAGARAGTKGQMDISCSRGGYTGYGYNNSNYRLLTGLYDPQSAHDAATKGYVDPTTDSTAPTTATVGRLGQIQIDTATATAYMCVEADDVTPSYTWKQITA